MIRLFRDLTMLCLCMMILACSLFTPHKNDMHSITPKIVAPDNFSKGYTLFAQHQYRQALPILHDYLTHHGPDDDNYAWALFFFGISLKENGLTHAAFDVFTRLIEQSPNAKIVTHALGLFETAMNEGLIDDDYIRETVFCSKDFAYVGAPLSSFIDYHQGLCNWQKGYIDWGNQQFQKIPLDSIYYLKYRFELARLMIQDNDIQKAMDILESLLTSDALSPSLQSKTRITLARLYYEQKNYDRADQLYQQIVKYHPDQAPFLLERAWAQYHFGHPDIALGLLIGLNAPDFKDQITPEYYLLKSLIYKYVCNYQEALAIVDEFQDHYHGLIQGIKNRNPLAEHRPALQLLAHRTKITALLRILEHLEHERKTAYLIDNITLANHLNTTYHLLIKKYKDQLKTIAHQSYTQLSDQILAFEENMRLMNYEIGLDMYQRVKQHTTQSKQAPSKMRVAHSVIYPFINEYWNDELDNLRVSLTDRCQTLEEWDIFFK
ncbi:MAG: tetratricopeptide repeat protein [Candidatus Magnetomorum sp.]|nr:tetratricopeptide repeat protein [Candidatus Magnetomorum sp.]